MSLLKTDGPEEFFLKSSPIDDGFVDLPERSEGRINVLRKATLAETSFSGDFFSSFSSEGRINVLRKATLAETSFSGDFLSSFSSEGRINVLRIAIREETSSDFLDASTVEPLGSALVESTVVFFESFCVITFCFSDFESSFLPEATICRLQIIILFIILRYFL